MQIDRHPAQPLLAAYAAGTLDEGASVLVASHLALCPQCRGEVGAIEAIGGAVLDDLPVTAVSVNAYDRIIAALDDGADETTQTTSSPARASVETDGTVALLPRPLRDYVQADPADLPWRRLTKGVEHIDLTTSGRSRARLLRISAGTKMPHHGHGGEELTMVLAGGYSDVTGSYARGDVAHADPDLVHQPVADADEPCVCLTVTRGVLLPTRFLAVFARIVQRLTA